VVVRLAVLLSDQYLVVLKGWLCVLGGELSPRKEAQHGCPFRV
jgi:hypothetical protein